VTPGSFCVGERLERSLSTSDYWLASSWQAGLVVGAVVVLVGVVTMIVNAVVAARKAINTGRAVWNELAEEGRAGRPADGSADL
jgi:hypothetical protein